MYSLALLGPVSGILTPVKLKCYLSQPWARKPGLLVANIRVDVFLFQELTVAKAC